MHSNEFHIRIEIPAQYAQKPNGKLADGELHFHGGPLAGLRLCGFTVWSNSKSSTGLNVTFPARSYMAGGVKRSFILLRDLQNTTTTGTDGLVALVTKAYQVAKTHLPSGGAGFAIVVPDTELAEATAAFTAAAKDLL